MEIGELVWLFHPPAPVNQAKLVSIGLKLINAEELMTAIRAELERHSDNGLLPGHWSERQQTWFFNPDIWTCIHSLLLGFNIKLNNLDPYLVLNQIGHSTDVLLCQQHPETYIIWLCDVWEEVMDKYDQWQMTEAQREWLHQQRQRLSELRTKWLQSMKTAKQSSSEEKPDNWLDNIEDEINKLYSNFKGGLPDS